MTDTHQHTAWILAPEATEPEFWAPEMWQWVEGFNDMTPETEFLYEDVSRCPIHVRLAWMVKTEGGPS
jgi:hypothetical protein